MTGTNHVLMGGLIAKYLPLPVALPVALASHFVLDALPHYGLPHGQRDASTFWRVFFIGDFIVAFSFAMYQIAQQNYAMFWGALFAVIPDFVWVVRVVSTRSFDMSNHNHWFTEWHARIQQYERPWGLRVEIPFGILLFCLIFFLPR